MTSGPQQSDHPGLHFGGGEFWQDRVSSLLTGTGQHTHVICDRRTGVEFVLSRISLEKTPLVTFRFESVASSKAISAVLAASVERDLGITLLRADATLRHSLVILSRLLVTIGPIRFAVVWSDFCIDLVGELSKAVGNLGQVISFCTDEYLNPRIPDNFRVIRGSDLLMSHSEAVVAAGGSMSAEDVAVLASQCGYRYGEFYSAVHPLAQRPYIPQTRSSARGLLVASSTSDLELLDVLIDRERWIEVFELVCQRLPGEASRVVGEACHHLVDLGAFEYMWDGISGLPEKIQKHPDVAYWLVVAASATNRLSLVRELAREVLEENEAPDLRAAVAVLNPSVDMVDEATRAVRALETPITLRAMGFALAYAGDREMPVHLFRKAMKLAESKRANHLVIACAIDIANQEITLGRYSSGVDWAKWALAEIDKRRSNERFRRNAALALYAYGSILSKQSVDDPEVVTAIQELVVDWSILGAPTYESVVSTVGDWHFASGNFTEAEEHYKRVLAGVPLDQYASAAIDVVKVLIAQGRLKEAQGLAEAARTIARSSTHTEYALACLAVGMSKADSDSAAVIGILREAQTGLAKSNFVVFETQAALWIAVVQLRSGRAELAKDTLRQVASGLAELGPAGWGLLLCGLEEWRTLFSLWKDEPPTVRFDFLGDRLVTREGASWRAPMRVCEVLAVLSSTENGISAERLQLKVFGDDSTTTNVKATVSRIRRSVPISQAPYRLSANVQSDFSELIEAVEAGELITALDLYKGPLLPGSDAPAVVELREYVDELLKGTILRSSDVELMIRLGTMMEGDLEIWERAKSLLAPKDSRRGLVNARIRRIRALWQS